MTIRAQILAEIKRRKLTNGELARRSGVDKVTIGRYIAGTRNITDETASRLMAGLGLEVKAKLDHARAAKFGLDVCRSLSKEFDRRTAK